MNKQQLLFGTLRCLYYFYSPSLLNNPHLSAPPPFSGSPPLTVAEPPCAKAHQRCCQNQEPPPDGGEGGDGVGPGDKDKAEGPPPQPRHSPRRRAVRGGRYIDVIGRKEPSSLPFFRCETEVWELRVVVVGYSGVGVWGKSSFLPI